MERQPSPKLEREPSLEMAEPLTLSKKQYQAALAAVVKSYSKGSTSAPQVVQKQPKKGAGKPKKGKVTFNV